MLLDVVINGDCLEKLKDLNDKSVECCVTSPPYYGLRDYGTGAWIGGDPNCPHYRTSKFSDDTATGHKKMMDTGIAVGDAIYKTVCPICGAVREDRQIGLEETPEAYIEKLVLVFREVRRVLKDDGALWVNIGDSYWGAGSHGNGSANGTGSYKSKDLIGVPWMLAFALRNDGWYLRQDIIWAKPNPMPESVKDRCTKSHEYIFMLTKNKNYYFNQNAIKEPTVTFDTSIRDRDHTKCNNTPGRTRMGGLKRNNYTMRNKRDVWNVSVSSTKEAHFATYPEALIEPCILATSRPGGVVLDPFFGSGTTGRVATRLNRHYIGIELNPEYIDISDKRIDNIQMSLVLD